MVKKKKKYTGCSYKKPSLYGEDGRILSESGQFKENKASSEKYKDHIDGA